MHGASGSIKLEHPELRKANFFRLHASGDQSSAAESFGRMMGRSTASPGMEVAVDSVDLCVSAGCVAGATVSQSLNRSSGASRGQIGPASPG